MHRAGLLGSGPARFPGVAGAGTKATQRDAQEKWEAAKKTRRHLLDVTHSHFENQLLGAAPTNLCKEKLVEDEGQAEGNL